jgi:DnaJ-class molecular chaperone
VSVDRLLQDLGLEPDESARETVERWLEALVATCQVCRGSGKAWGANPNKPCEGCGGAGKVRIK